MSSFDFMLKEKCGFGERNILIWWFELFVWTSWFDSANRASTAFTDD